MWLFGVGGLCSSFDTPRERATQDGNGRICDRYQMIMPTLIFAVLSSAPLAQRIEGQQKCFLPLQ